MTMTLSEPQESCSTNSCVYGGYIDPLRRLVDIPNHYLVEVSIPEYERNGCGRALLKVIRYYFEDLHMFGVEGISIGAESSRGHIIFDDMNPVVVGASHSEIQKTAPRVVIEALYKLGLPIELITLGALRHNQFEHLDELVNFIRLYFERASWMESHPIDVKLSNSCVDCGDVGIFDWQTIFLC